MGYQDDRNPTNRVADPFDVAKTDHAEPNRKSELSDEQLAKISGGNPVGFPDNGGSGDTSITPVPTAPGSNPSMP